MQRCFYDFASFVIHIQQMQICILCDANNDTLIVAEYCDKLAQHDTINADTIV